MNKLLAGGGTPSFDGYIINPAFGFNLNFKLGAGSDAGYISSIVGALVSLLFMIGGIIFFFQLAWGAVGWILSGGDKASLEAAKNKITNAIIGLILLIATFAIIKIIERFFGINILSIDIGPLFIQ